jgi:hypothetical protein
MKMNDHPCQWAFNHFDNEFKEFSDTRPVFVCEENGRKYIIQNKDSKHFCKYLVDNGLIKDKAKEKCDFLVIKCEDKIACLIELKGTNVKKAINQILSTISDLGINWKLLQISLHARIVATKIDSPRLIETTKIRLQRKLKEIGNGKLLIKSVQYKEELF